MASISTRRLHDPGFMEHYFHGGKEMCICGYIAGGRGVENDCSVEISLGLVKKEEAAVWVDSA